MLGIGTLVSLFTAVLATQAALGRDGPFARWSRIQRRSARAAGQSGWTFDFMGASKWFFSLSGTILLIGALAIGGKGPELRHRLQVRHAHPDGVRQARHRAAKSRTSMSAAGYAERAGAEVSRTRASAADGYQISTKTLQPTNSSRRSKRARHDVRQRAHLRPGTKDFSAHLDRADVRENVANSAIIAIIASLLVISRVYRAAVRVEVRGAGADRADARPADHGRRLLAHRPGSDDGDGRGAADDPGVFAVRHDHRVRSCARERAADAARRVLADRQPLDVRGADADRWRRASARCCRCWRCCCSAAKR